MKTKIIIFCLVLFSINLVGQNNLSLSEAIAIGLENNYSLRISRKNVEISQENNSWGAAGRYPTIDVSVTSINRFNHTEDPSTDITTNNIAPSANLNWVLFNGFKIFNTKSKLEDQFERAQLIDAIKGKQGVNGIHLMAVGWESIVPRLVTESGLLPPDFVAPEETGDPVKVKVSA